LGANILVIDDDAIVRRTLQEILESEGYQVTCAENGRYGLAAFERRRPDLVITDIIMPDQEGIETIVHLRKVWPEGPIIAISGGGRIGNVDFLQMAERIGADAILAKPFEPEELLSHVARCLAKNGGA